MLFPTFWDYRTSVQSENIFTHFHLIHNIEVVLPIDFKILSLHLAIKLLPYTSSLENWLITFE